MESSSALVMSILILARDMASPVIRGVGTALTSLGPLGIAAAAAGAAIAGIGVAATVTAASFDQVMHKIAGLTDTNAQEMDYYKQKILELGPSLDLSATDMGKAWQFAA